MPSLFLLPLLLGPIFAAEEPSRCEPPVRYGPCGVYDIGELDDHFLVRVDQRPSDFDPEQIAVTITLVDRPEEGDKRQPLPLEDLVVELKDDAGKTIASSPLHWHTTPYTLTKSAERLAKVTLSPSAAKQIFINRQPKLGGIDHPHLLVTFKSLAKPKEPE